MNKKIRSRLEQINFIFKTSLVVKLFSVLSILIIVPTVHASLSDERFALWTILTGLTAVSQFSDLGIGNSLINIVSELNAENNHEEIRKAITNASVILFLLGILMLIVYISFYFLVDWAKLLNFKYLEIMNEAKLSFSMVILLFVINLPFNTVQRVQIGMQRGHIANIWNIAGLILSLFGVIICSHIKATLLSFVLATIGGPLVATIMSWSYEYYVFNPKLRPKATDLNFHSWPKIISQSSLWALVQLVAFLAVGLDAMIVSYYFTPISVTQYSILLRLYSGLLIAPLYSAPSWPAFNDAIKNKDIKEAKKILKTVTLIGLILGIIGALIVYFCGQMLIDFWLIKTIILDSKFVVAFSIWLIVSSLYACLSSPMSAQKTLPSLLIYSTSAAFIATLIKICLLPNAGPEFVVLANSIGYGLMCVFAYYKLSSFIKYESTLN